MRRRQRQAAAALTARVPIRSVARELHQVRARTLDARYSQQIMERLERHASPDLGSLPITEITAPLVLEVVRAVEETGALEMAHRVRSHISDVFVHAIATGRSMTDPAAIISKALVVRSPKLRPAQTKIEVARSALVAVESAPVCWGPLLASRLLALTAARPGVVRLAERGEFEQLDTPNPILRVPAAKMKLTRRQKRVVGQWSKAFEDELNLKLFGQRRRSRYVEHSLDGLQRGDFKSRIEALARAIQTGQLMPNEARALENRPPDPNGQGGKLYIQGATVSLGTTPPPTGHDDGPAKNDNGDPADGDAGE